MTGGLLEPKFYRQIVESAFEGIAVIDPNLQITFVNQRWMQMLGYSMLELNEMSFCDIFPIDIQGPILKRFRKDADDFNSFEVCLIKKSGDLIWVNAIFRNQTYIFIREFTASEKSQSDRAELSLNHDQWIHEKNYSLLHAHHQLEREALERRKVEDTLVSAQAALQSFFESSPLFLGIVDLTPDGTRHVLDSPSTSLFFGVKPGGTVGMYTREFKVLPENLKQMNVRCEQSQAEKRPIQWEFTTFRGLGHLRTFSCYTNYIGMSPDGLPRFSYTLEEITEKRELERKRDEQISRLSQLSKMSALGEMASGIAHEIYNPLTIIKGYADLLAKRSQQGEVDCQELVTITKEIQSTCKRVNEIVEGLRFFAREGSSDAMDLIRVEDLISSTTKICLERFKKYGVTLKLAQSDPSLTVSCRQVQVSQVILNLLNNAFDAVKNEEIKIIQIDVQSHENAILISISDSGGGIPETLHSKVFEPFFTTKPIGLGTGMGLSICRGIMESHFGSIYLIPSSQGACFQLRLPQGYLKVKTSESDQ